jgi:hypothetical protein
MADDPEHKRIILQLMGSSQVSKKYCLEELGIDPNEENKQLEIEAEQNLMRLKSQLENQTVTQNNQMRATAVAEGEAMVIKSEAQAKSVLLMEKIRGQGAIAIDDYKEMVNQLANTGINSNKGNTLIDKAQEPIRKLQAEMYMKHVPENLKHDYLNAISKTDPTLAKYLGDTEKEWKDQASKEIPLNTPKTQVSPTGMRLSGQ